MVDAGVQAVSIADLVPERPKWMLRARCINEPADTFFPERGDITTTARRICSVCPVRAECLAYGMRENHGIWGGTTPRERRALRSRAA
jgi:WhiB family redox-sensing transcriptional regulator